MTDLIYGGNEHEDELRELFPDAVIEDAGDEIHEGRVSISVDMDDWEYIRVAFLHGFFDLSLNMQLRAMGDGEEFKRRIEQWQRDYPEYFKGFQGGNHG
jgi:hypothetical protein